MLEFGRELLQSPNAYGLIQKLIQHLLLHVFTVKMTDFVEQEVFNRNRSHQNTVYKMKENVLDIEVMNPPKNDL